MNNTNSIVRESDPVRWIVASIIALSAIVSLPVFFYCSRKYDAFIERNYTRMPEELELSVFNLQKD